MVTLELTADVFAYLRRAMARDLEELEEMAPWDIDDHDQEHADEMRLCKKVSALLAAAEQAQLTPH